MADPRLGDLGDRLGIVLKDPDAIQQAFVHSSTRISNAVSGHNERLEFLGDAVIGLIVSRLLYERFPDEDEGLLTARRAALVNRDALASLGLRIGLDRYFRLGRESPKPGRHPPIGPRRGIRGLAGAIFLSEGVDVTREWLQRLFEAPLRAPASPEPPKSAKSRLQEWSQREHRIKPHYELVSTTGPDHDQTFTVQRCCAESGSRSATAPVASARRSRRPAPPSTAWSAAGIEGEPAPRMRLQFKTFADPTRFVFEPGVNAVIGPNGSGKSNMADAGALGAGRAVEPPCARVVPMTIFAGSPSHRAWPRRS